MGGQSRDLKKKQKMVPEYWIQISKERRKTKNCVTVAHITNKEYEIRNKYKSIVFAFRSSKHMKFN